MPCASMLATRSEMSLTDLMLLSAKTLSVAMLLKLYERSLSSLGLSGLASLMLAVYVLAFSFFISMPSLLYFCSNFLNNISFVLNSFLPGNLRPLRRKYTLHALMFRPFGKIPSFTNAMSILVQTLSCMIPPCIRSRASCRALSP